MYTRIRRKCIIELFEVLLHKVFQILQREVLGLILIWEYKTYQLTFALNYHGLSHTCLIVQFIFYFLWVDILSTSTKEHRLDTTADIDKLLLIHISKVACTKPTVLGKGSTGSLLVLVISHHHILATS